MFSPVPIKPIRLESYQQFLDHDDYSELKRLGQQLQGTRVLQLNTTGFGTRVADMIGVVGGLQLGLGLDCEWQVLRVTSELLDVYRRIYDALQGASVTWDPEMASTWLEYHSQNASQFDREYDFVIVHDPQAAPILSQIIGQRGRPPGKWIWHCHQDLRQSNPEVRRFLAQAVEPYDATVAEMEGYLDGEDLPNPTVILPAIDPLNARNADVPSEAIRAVLFSYRIDPSRRIVSQVSHLEPQADPMGAIAAWRIAKEQIPDLEMILAFPTVARGTATHSLFHRLVAETHNDPSIHILSPVNGLGNLEVNLLHRASDVIIQKSIGRGFGLMVAEAMWKAKPVVAGNRGGISLQVKDGETGYLCDAVQSCGDRLVNLLRNKGQAQEMGRRGKEHVRRNFLITRYLKDYLSFMSSMSSGTSNACA